MRVALLGVPVGYAAAVMIMQLGDVGLARITTSEVGPQAWTLACERRLAPCQLFCLHCFI